MHQQYFHTLHVIHQNHNTQQGYNLGPIQQGTSWSLHKPEPVWFHTSIQSLYHKTSNQTPKTSVLESKPNPKSVRDYPKSVRDYPKIVLKFQFELSKNSFENSARTIQKQSRNSTRTVRKQFQILLKIPTLSLKNLGLKFTTFLDL